MTIILFLCIFINILLLQNSRDAFSKLCFAISMAILLFTLFYDMVINAN